MSAERILVVEDNATNMKLLLFILNTRSYDIRTAGNATEAFAILETFSPHLILMDVQLPGIDGLEVTRRLKADPGMRGIPIVAITAYAMTGDRERVKAAGCSDYVTKPIKRVELLSLVDRYLGTAGE